jgi:hypothetical protein
MAIYKRVKARERHFLRSPHGAAKFKKDLVRDGYMSAEEAKLISDKEIMRLARGMTVIVMERMPKIAVHRWREFVESGLEFEDWLDKALGEPAFERVPDHIAAGMEEFKKYLVKEGMLSEREAEQMSFGEAARLSRAIVPRLKPSGDNSFSFDISHECWRKFVESGLEWDDWQRSTDHCWN